MKITCGKDYEQANSTSIENMEYVRRFLHDIDNTLRCLKSRVFGYNKDWFQDIWGKQDFCWTGGSENRRFYVWVREEKNCIIIVLTNSSKGTCYECVVTGDNGKAQKEVVNFVEYIIENNPNRRDKHV